ncbi:MAG: ABC transporter ATP-binding protein [Raoultibacter sp.]
MLRSASKPNNEARESSVTIEHVGMSFNVANEQLNSLKEYFIKIIKHELFFKEFIALDDISLDVKKGDVYGIVGTNGSGKSTLLKIVAGVLEPTKGKVFINGNIAPLIELGAGFDMELTARENIYLNGSLLGYSRSFINQHFDEIVDFAEVHDFLEMPMKNYSSGMVARVAFAVATVIVPDILIVDEALSVGDVFFQEKCENRIQSLIDDYHTTVLFVSHSIDQVERVCEKAVWIEKGHLMMDGAVKQVCEAYRNMQND